MLADFFFLELDFCVVCLRAGGCEVEDESAVELGACAMRVPAHTTALKISAKKIDLLNPTTSF
jgi:hypothetical protein